MSTTSSERSQCTTCGYWYVNHFRDRHEGSKQCSRNVVHRRVKANIEQANIQGGFIPAVPFVGLFRAAGIKMHLLDSGVEPGFAYELLLQNRYFVKNVK